MFFGRNRFNFVFVGAGSSVFTMRLVGDILSEDFIEGGELRLVDIDAALLAEIGSPMIPEEMYARIVNGEA